MLRTLLNGVMFVFMFWLVVDPGSAVVPVEQLHHRRGRHPPLWSGVH